MRDSDTASKCRKKSRISCSSWCEQPLTGNSYISVSFSGSRVKCLIMTMAIRPASPWTRAVLAVIVDLEKSRRCTVDLTQDSRADQSGELRQWLGIPATS